MIKSIFFVLGLIMIFTGAGIIPGIILILIAMAIQASQDN